MIKEMQQQLCNPSKQFEDMQRRFVLIGMGGIGKSEICLKVAENVRDRFVVLLFRGLITWSC